jgi:predicted dehydrogenase
MPSTDRAAIRVGLVGAGRMSGHHLRGFARAGVEVAAVCDPNPDAADAAAALAGGAETFRDIRDMLRGADLDAVDIAVPHHLHADFALAALESGRHVYLEKPLAATVAEGRMLVDAAERSDRVFMVGHNLLFHPAVRAARRCLADREIGRIVTVEAWTSGWLDLEPGDFRLDAAQTGGGAWIDCASHLLYTLEAMLGPFAAVRAVLNAGESRVGAEDTAVAAGRFDSGASATLRMSYSDVDAASSSGWPDDWRTGYVIRGTLGRLEVEVLPRAVVRFQQLGHESEVAELDSDFGLSFDSAILEFIDSIREGRAPAVTARDALRTLSQIAEAPGPLGWNAA